MNKKLTSILLVMLLLLGLIPTSAAAATSDFLIENGVLLSYSGKATTIVIPKGVTVIGS